MEVEGLKPYKAQKGRAVEIYRKTTLVVKSREILSRIPSPMTFLNIMGDINIYYKTLTLLRKACL